MSNSQKTPFARSINRFAQSKALDEITKRGQALPGHVVDVFGQIVTINFDVSGVTIPEVTIPIATSEYIRLPVQVGDKGMVMPSDAYLGGISGLGGGVADLTLRGNLSDLVWVPVANALWNDAPGSDSNTLALYGKTALLLLDSLAGHASVKLTASAIALTFGSGSITMNSSGITLSFGGHSIVINGSNVTIDGKAFLPHTHSDPQGGNTGAVN